MTEKRDAARVAQILEVLSKEHPDARCLLDHGNAIELLVATILAAQCTDARVNEVTKELFRKHRTAEDYARADEGELQGLIRPTGFYRNKAKAIRGACQALVERHGGEAPADMDALVKLPGVGRKTANVLLGVWYGQPAIIVDTHLSRVTQRLGLTHETDPDKIEEDLRRSVPKARWTEFSHGIGFHGRRVCKARKPECEACRISRWCDTYAALRAAGSGERTKRQETRTTRR